MSATHSQFERLIRDYLSGRVSWNQVHEVALQLEVENNADFDDNPVLEELQMIFLADENDDRSFAPMTMKSATCWLVLHLTPK
jgi:hypothetical protein